MIYFYSRNRSIFESDKYIQLKDFSFIEEYFRDVDEIQVDTETEGYFNHHNRILTLQLGTFSDQFVLDFQSLVPKEREVLLEWLKTPLKRKIIHNAKFDIKFFWREGLDINNVFCTLNAECILGAGKKREAGYYTLYRVVQDYCGVKLDKSVRGEINRYGFTESVILYAANDVKYLSEVKAKQMERLISLNLASEDTQDELTVLGLENKTTIVLAHIEYVGIGLDRVKWKEVSSQIGLELDQIREKINEYIWNEDTFTSYRIIYQDLFTSAHNTTNLNLNSPVQKLEFLKKIIPELENTSERVLSRYKLNYPIVKLFLEYSKMNKLLTSFANKMLDHINPLTNRIHPEFWQILNSGRMSCNNPNMQQIPGRTDIGKLMRQCFISSLGYDMVGGDYSGCELRIIAEFSEDPVWLKVLKEGGDLHSTLCSLTFNIPIEDVRSKSHFKEDLSYRDIQKTLDFGLAYGMSEFKLADTIEVSIDVARNIIKEFFSRVPKVQKFLNGLSRSAVKYLRIRTPKPYGRIRWFDPHDNNPYLIGKIERAARNHPIQGGNADLIKLSLVRCYDYIRDKDWWNPVTGIDDCKIILPVHDEIITECKESLSEEWRGVMENIMVSCGEVIVKSIPMPADCSISKYWSK